MAENPARKTLLRKSSRECCIGNPAKTVQYDRNLLTMADNPVSGLTTGTLLENPAKKRVAEYTTLENATKQEADKTRLRTL